MSHPRDVVQKAMHIGVAAFNAGEKISAEFLAISYGALVRQMIDDLAQEDDFEGVNQELEAMGRRIGARLIEEYSVRSGAPPCRSFAQAAESVAWIGLRMFLNISADVTPVKTTTGEHASKSDNDTTADCFAITFHDNPLALFVELPSGPLAERLWYSNILCGIIAGALVIVGFRCEVNFVRDKLRGDAKNEIRIHFQGRERETFQLDDN